MPLLASWSRRKTIGGIAGTTVLGLTIATVASVTLSSSGGAAASSTSVPTATAKVIRTDLSTTQQVNGSITFANTYTVVNPAGTPNQTLTQAQQAVATAQTTLNGANTALADTNNVNGLTINQSQATLARDTATLNTDQAQQAADQTKLARDTAKQQADCAGKGTSACQADAQQLAQDNTRLTADNQTITKDNTTVSADQAALSLAQAKATQTTDQAQAAFNTAQQALTNGQAQVAAASQNATIAGAGFTELPAVGQHISQGQTLYSIDGRPVPLFYGTVTPWRDFAPGMTDGADVAELEANLVQLGFGAGLIPSSHYGPEAVATVQRWQASLGLPQTGQVRLGEVIFEPEELRVSNVHGAVGGPAQPGQAVLDATGTTPTVTVPLNVNQEYLVHQGDPVHVNLPDGKTTLTGNVTSINSVATPVPGAQPGSVATNSSNNGPQATVNVTVGLDHFTPQGPIDQEPVTVELTDQTAKSALAVPVTALLALSGGGYGVKVVSGPTPQIVAVQTGLFTNTMVQISGPGIAEGRLVQVPSS